MPALLPVRRRLRRVAVTLAVLPCLAVVGLAAAACGGPAQPGLASSTPAATSGPANPSPSASATATAGQVVVDITIADGHVTPNGEKVDVAVGQQVVLHVTSDVDDEIHAHTDTEGGYELEVTAGKPATGSFTVSSPGSFEVESHHLEKTIVILNVR